ncbi:hypothetical protein GCM10011506_43200 [Marivirga lumbricoides]|uniref:Uncharacterized protein n=1 Tax=Marivirga lumbricoides TaxID=1046115 RepID=A0ABQ1N4K1_9BACT|nr:hypothetical protein GCM10011506_43200 [Marivirga lumbricoides]
MEKQIVKKLFIVNSFISLTVLLLFHVTANYFFLSDPIGFSTNDVSILSILLAILFLTIGTVLNIAFLFNRNIDPHKYSKTKFVFISSIIVILTTFLLDATYQLFNKDVSLAYSKALFTMFGGAEMDEISLKVFYKMPFFLKNIFSNLISIFLFQLISIYLYSNLFNFNKTTFNNPQ